MPRKDLWFDALLALFARRENSLDTNAEDDLWTFLAQENLDDVDTKHFIGSWHNLPVLEVSMDESSSITENESRLDEPELDRTDTSEAEEESIRNSGYPLPLDLGLPTRREPGGAR